MLDLFTLLPILWAMQGEQPDLTKVRLAAYAKMALADKIAGDPELVAATVAKNAVPESMELIKKRDTEWQANRSFPLRKELTSNACAIRLRSLVQHDPVIVEAFLMDKRGGLVCASIETEDYWQGDEAKWQKTYRDGARVFLDEPRLDVNTNTFAVQLSVLVGESDRKLGALTLTLKVPREMAGR